MVPQKELVYKITNQEKKVIEKYIETLDYIETFDYANYPIPQDVEDIDKYKRQYIQKLLRRKDMALALKVNSQELMRANTASAAEVLYFFSKVMRGEVKDQFGLDAPLSERLKAAVELARRTVDIENKGSTDNNISITLNWNR